jgi:hypothetical protein
MQILCLKTLCIPSKFTQLPEVLHCILFFQKYFEVIKNSEKNSQLQESSEEGSQKILTQISHFSHVNKFTLATDMPKTGDMQKGACPFRG